MIKRKINVFNLGGCFDDPAEDLTSPADARCWVGIRLQRLNGTLNWMIQFTFRAKLEG